MSLELLAPAKVTISLRIIGTRSDGYHLIDAEMVTVDLYDRLCVDPEGVGVDMGEGASPTSDEENLITKALRLSGREARVTVDKAIPPMAGLGGGSADAAAVLRWAGFHDLNAASKLGADVPFCMVGGRARVTGIGEIVEPLNHERQQLTLVTPEFGCSTPEVYAAWDALGGPTGEYGNDLEPAALVVQPRLAQVRDEIAAKTGIRPRLAGSGSTWVIPGSHNIDGGRVVTTLRSNQT